MFIAEPAELSSFRDELVFEYTQEESSDLTFEIEFEDEEECQEVKKLYNVSDATINIAPIIASRFMTTPASGVSSLETPDCGYGLVAVRCGEESSESKYFVAAQQTLPDVGLITTLPKSRFISYGEADELWIRAQEGSEVLVTVETTDEGGVRTTSFEHTAQACGFVRFRFNTSDFGAYTKVAKVSIFCDAESVAEVEYYYISKVRGAVRLAWIGACGGIEHYTFPTTNLLTLYSNGVREYSIESAFESQEVVEALGEILSSQSVWIVEEDLYTEVEVLSESVALNRSGELSTVEYKIERYD